MKKNYVFGYGSIINLKSANKTTKAKNLKPKTIFGFSREWNINIEGVNQTALGIIKKKGSKCNGVLVEVDDLKEMDKREIGYNRVLVEDNIWVYIPKKTNKATKDYPIVQSYVDVVLEGCFKISNDFAKEFIDTTNGWKYLVNDRENPKYPRAEKNLIFKKEIDFLLSSHPKTKFIFKN